jgi:nucleoid DNA-binding protein
VIVNELINIIVQKTGISQENAQKAVQVTVDFLKSKLPGPIAVQLNSFLMGRTSAGNLSGVLAEKG